MTLDLDAKKVLLRKIPHGLFICGVRDGEEMNGFTASWVTQGSFDPPLIVMAVRAEGSSHGIIQRTKCFSLNVLRSDQKDLAAVFFKPQSALGGRFESAPFHKGELGLPILDNAIGGVECQLVGEVANGDHTIFVAEVMTAELIEDKEPLVLSTTGWSYGG
ncbi:flavin reductase family protein [Prochlorococcus sp. MIT 1300]|uniref:flavin reductase family protein n=1 Tax=Prochlorococcus sp. MIT 1300 TaxID=3096218 RepID=UPI002A761023|nr:flavin reductase family protein [Prochlorococcus sp. MIT 1300]